MKFFKFAFAGIMILATSNVANAAGSLDATGCLVGTLTSKEAIQECDARGLNCCNTDGVATTDRNLVCEWSGKKDIRLCPNSCNGGVYTCYGMREVDVGENSCNYDTKGNRNVGGYSYACLMSYGSIGDNSCNGYHTCYSTIGVGYDSCNTDYTKGEYCYLTHGVGNCVAKCNYDSSCPSASTCPDTTTAAVTTTTAAVTTTTAAVTTTTPKSGGSYGDPHGESFFFTQHLRGFMPACKALTRYLLFLVHAQSKLGAGILLTFTVSLLADRSRRTTKVDRHRWNESDAIISFFGQVDVTLSSLTIVPLPMDLDCPSTFVPRSRHGRFPTQNTMPGFVMCLLQLTAALPPPPFRWSYIDSAVLRLGDHTLEVKGGKKDATYWIDFQEGNDLVNGEEGSLGGFSYHVKVIDGHRVSQVFVV